jgi:hypothetical protein
MEPIQAFTETARSQQDPSTQQHTLEETKEEAAIAANESQSQSFMQIVPPKENPNPIPPISPQPDDVYTTLEDA